MLMNQVVIVLIILTGILLLVASIIRWQPLFENNKSEFLNNKLGTHAARILYALIGILVIIMGIYLYNSKKLNNQIPESEIIFQL